MLIIEILLIKCFLSLLLHTKTINLKMIPLGTLIGFFVTMVKRRQSQTLQSQNTIH